MPPVDVSMCMYKVHVSVIPSVSSLYTLRGIHGLKESLSDRPVTYSLGCQQVGGQCLAIAQCRRWSWHDKGPFQPCSA